VKKMDVLLKKVRVSSVYMRSPDIGNHQLYPGGDYMQALEIDADDGKRVLSKPAPSLDGLVLPSAPHPSLLCAHKDLGDESSDDDVPSFLTVALDKPTPGPTPRYFGKSSNTGIFKRVVEKKTALMNKPPKQDARRPEYWRINPVSCAFISFCVLRLTRYPVGDHEAWYKHVSHVHLSRTRPIAYPHKRLLHRNQHPLASSSPSNIREFCRRRSASQGQWICGRRSPRMRDWLSVCQ
jgi:hypothetical protein